MPAFCSLPGGGPLVARPLLRIVLVLCCLLALARSTHAQTASWQAALASSGTTTTGTATAQATAPDGSGNVYVAGYFSGQVSFGSTLLTSAGSFDAFVAKWSPSTGTWVWALSGGGTLSD